MRVQMLDSMQLTGRAASHVVEVADLRCSGARPPRLHADVAAALLTMAAAAREDGIQLAVVSSFRSFEHQVAIWNGKYQGERPLLDRSGRALDRAGLDESSMVEAILVWSALPGASRHHWGTDVDVVDAASAPEGYRPQLTAEEFHPRGVFAKLEGWLSANMGQFGFFRPYSRDLGGVQPEPWHLSYAPLAVQALEALTVEVLAEALAGSALCARELVVARLGAIHARYVKAVDSPEGLSGPPQRRR
jgi:LAS superfamily LD-carboxypeptidase LdcB